MTKLRFIQRSPIAIAALCIAVGCQPQPSAPKPENPTSVNTTLPGPTAPPSNTPEDPPDLSQANLDEQIRIWQTARLERPQTFENLTQFVKAMRLTGRSAEAIQSLSPSDMEQLPALEKASLLAESGDWVQASEMLRKANMHTLGAFQPKIDNLFQHVLRGQGEKAPDPTDEIQLVNLVLSFTGDRAGGAAIQNLQLERVARIRRIADLQTMQMIAPNEPAIAAMLREAEDLEKPFKDAKLFDNQTSAIATTESEREDHRLYQLHCSACHGANGDGKGPASRFLDPPARSFIKEPMRYVSGVRSLATDEDLRKTIVKGLEGVSMPGFPQLPANEIEALIREVRRFQKLGLEAAYDRNRRASSNSGAANPVADTAGAVIGNDSDMQNSETQNSEIMWVANRWRDTEQLTLPDWLMQSDVNSPTAALAKGHGGNSNQGNGDASKSIDESLVKGAAIFRKMGCQSCHTTEDSTKAKRLQFNDSLGRTLSARNLSKEPLRRGVDRREIYWRIFLGIPGTPHPKVEGSLADDDARSLVDYVADLAQSAEGLKSTNHSRRISH